MRLCFCYHCKTLSKIADYVGSAAADHQLQNWIDRHMHGMSLDEHPGGRVFPFDGADIEVTGGKYDGVRVNVSQEVDAVRKELIQAGVEIMDLRDELKEDAHKCFIKHSRPNYPDHKCIDYHDDSKWLGRKVKVEGEVFRTRQGYLCSCCPYETNVVIAQQGG